MINHAHTRVIHAIVYNVMSVLLIRYLRSAMNENKNQRHLGKLSTVVKLSIAP
jgi:uncharacterized membrane protein